MLWIKGQTVARDELPASCMSAESRRDPGFPALNRASEMENFSSTYLGSLYKNQFYNPHLLFSFESLTSNALAVPRIAICLGLILAARADRPETTVMGSPCLWSPQQENLCRVQLCVTPRAACPVQLTPLSHVPRPPGHVCKSAIFFLRSLWWITTYLHICQRKVTDTETSTHPLPRVTLSLAGSPLSAGVAALAAPCRDHYPRSNTARFLWVPRFYEV